MSKVNDFSDRDIVILILWSNFFTGTGAVVAPDGWIMTTIGGFAGMCVGIILGAVYAGVTEAARVKK